MFSDIYKSLKTNAPPVPLDNVCVAQSQIVHWVRKHKEEIIKDGRSMFFLLKKDESILCKDDPNNENLFVAHVRVLSVGYLRVLVYRFSDGHTWCAEYYPWFVVPQLTAWVLLFDT